MADLFGSDPPRSTGRKNASPKKTDAPEPKESRFALPKKAEPVPVPAAQVVPEPPPQIIKQEISARNKIYEKFNPISQTEPLDNANGSLQKAIDTLKLFGLLKVEE